jgi:hypothetical protein
MEEEIEEFEQNFKNLNELLNKDGIKYFNIIKKLIKSIEEIIKSIFIEREKCLKEKYFEETDHIVDLIAKISNEFFYLKKDLDLLLFDKGN